MDRDKKFPLDPVQIPAAPTARNPLVAAFAPAADVAVRNRAAADQEARAGDTAYSRGQLPQALQHYGSALRLAPNVAMHHFRLACTGWSLGQRDLGRHHLEETVRLDPRHAGAHEALGQLYMELGLIEPALRHSAAAVEIDPNNPHFAVSRAMVLNTNRDSEPAWQIVDRLLDSGFQSPRFALLYSKVAKQRKQEARAMELVQRVLQSGQIVRREDALAAHFAAADLLDRLGRYDEAFAHARQANSIVGAHYDAAATERTVDAHIRYFTRQKLRSLPRATHGSQKPVLIVGMPRSGTSLVEQILASHPAVHGAGELEMVFQIANEIVRRHANSGVGFPQVLDLTSTGLADEMARRYLEPLESAAPNALRITDKLPLNFAQLGLISLLFPEARVIHCRRDPRDTCLSCFMTHFAAGNEFSYNLTSAGHFYRQYEKLMTHWKSVLDLPILDVTYEQLAREQETQSRRMLDFVGLPWDERCLRFHENPRYVPTASSTQVRQPMYTSSLERWRHYERHLGPLMVALGWG